MTADSCSNDQRLNVISLLLLDYFCAIKMDHQICNH